MKKLSLAIIVAISAFSSINAAPLEDAIKDIDVSGFGRYRYQSTRTHGSLPANKSVDAHHRFTLDVNFKATLDDNFFSVIGVRYDSADVSGTGVNRAYKGITNNRGGLMGINSGPNKNGWGGSGDSFAIRQYYIGFTGIPDTTVLLGRQTIGGFFADDAVGTGMLVLNNSIEGLTFGLIAYDNIEDEADEGAVPDPYDAFIYQNNLYGASIIANYDWFFAQAWYGHLQNVANFWVIDIDPRIKISDDISLRARVNVGGTHLTGRMKDASPLNGNSMFYAINLGGTFSYFDIDAGFISFGKKNHRSAHALEHHAKYIFAGEELLHYEAFSGKNTAWFVKAGVNYEGYSVGVDYVHDKIKADPVHGGQDVKASEIVARAGYRYNDKLSFKAWYSFITKKEVDTGLKEKSDRFRFDATYNF